MRKLNNPIRLAGSAHLAFARKWKCMMLAVVVGGIDIPAHASNLLQSTSSPSHGA